MTSSVRKREEDFCNIERSEKRLRSTDEDEEYPFEPVQINYSLHSKKIPKITTLPLDEVSLLLERDIIETMLDEEEKKSRQVNYRTKEVNFKLYFEVNRKHVLSWMTDFCEEQKISLLTLHYAVSYLDRFIQNYPKLTKDKYQLIAAACILIAGLIHIYFNNTKLISKSKKRRKR